MVYGGSGPARRNETSDTALGGRDCFRALPRVRLGMYVNYSKLLHSCAPRNLPSVAAAITDAKSE